jgi:hypothetical protein
LVESNHDRAGATQFRAGIEDLLIVPLVAAAWLVRRLARAALDLLIRILDWSFPLLLQLARFPLFTLRIAGDVIVAAMRGIVKWLPIGAARRASRREAIAAQWAWLRRHISYKAFEAAVHHAFEAGMEWVFGVCRTLTPTAALAVIAGAVLWLPLSFGIATALHAYLLAKATSLPAWMQLLHPVATVIAKSKLLVLPAYPAAWPQARRHPLVQGLAAAWRRFKLLYLVRKTAWRYGQVAHGADAVVADLRRAAAARRSAFWRRHAAALARAGSAWRAAIGRLLARLAALPLVAPVVAAYAERYRRVGQGPPQPLSERTKAFFARWSEKFSAEYYEARERERAALAAAPAPPPER